MAKLLQKAFDAGQKFGDYRSNQTFNQWLNDMKRSNSLALGKPEPLAKNKQTENDFSLCIEVNKPYKDAIDTCKNQCSNCSRIEKLCRDATSR